MRNIILLFVSLAAASVLASGLVLASVLTARPAEAIICGRSWSIVPSAKGLRDARALAPVASNDIWIVGSRTVGSVANATGAQHWDGNSWTLVSTPYSRNGQTFTESALNGADALGSNSVWAVGYAAPSGSRSRIGYETVIERWDGTQWKLVASPNVGADTNSLTGVDALKSDLAWAVGFYRMDTVRHSLILRWDGASWNVVSNPAINASGSSLLDVAAASTDDIWAVGYKTFRNKATQSLVLHYNGSAWQQVYVPTLGSGENVLTGVSVGSSDSVWAAGYYVDGNQHKTLTLHYDGTIWKHVPSANEGQGISVLRDIEASSQSDAWAVGFSNRPSLNNFGASTQHWDDSAWSAVPTAISSSTGQSEMISVTKTPGTSQVWAAGPSTEHRDGSTWVAGPFSDVETTCP